MTTRPSARWIRSLACVALWLAAPAAHGLVFDYRSERFEVSGQTIFADEFGDGVLAPWTSALGTAVESGGVLSLESPGTEVLSLDLLGGPPIQVSNALAPAGANVFDGSGDFAAEATWLDLPGPPAGPLGGFYAVQLFSARVSTEPACIALAGTAGEPTAFETVAATVALRNFDPVVPPFTGPTGLTAAAVFTQTCVGGTADPLDDRVYLRTPVDVSGIDPGDVTGDLVLRLAFADASNDVTPSFSVDGGSSFTPLAAIAFPAFAGPGRFQLVAQPVRVVSVPALPLAAGIALAVALLGSVARRRRPGSR